MNKRPGKPADALASLAVALALAAAARLYGQRPAALLTGHRGPVPIARTRQTAMYLARIAFKLPFTTVGRLLGRDRTTIRHGCAAIALRSAETRLDLGLAALVAGLRAQRQAIIAGLALES